MFLKTAELICDLRLRSERVSILCMCRKQKNNTHAPRKNEPCTEHINVQDKQKTHAPETKSHAQTISMSQMSEKVVFGGGISYMVTPPPKDYLFCLRIIEVRAEDLATEPLPLCGK